MNKDMIEINDQTNKGEIKMKKMKHILKNEKGLTLVELLAVIVILAIVAAIAVPSIGNIIENSRYNAVKADATNVLNAAQLYFIEDPIDDTTKVLDIEVTVEELKSEGYLESEGEIPVTTTVKRTKPLTITTGDIIYSGDKTVAFTAATLKGITEDKQKGSAASITAITKATDETVTE
ncbi:type IV pilus assembly protein PilA [Psychrobacillus psychrotolerans]|uniref:Type IV pilus assembly protein PilA n=1 Tax=Psychrobacillus psychrotolerans TaxID=126156 RepID=A0A1I5YV24_9BACI|nr:prepilin-type N-terminal cleavage/methylation domain-containing protein [Psychrobacillus psychrotolerans]SFQ48032.1 type IV pilus assembly protein PilA [Psychrobacillus psychrotolerans]